MQLPNQRVGRFAAAFGCRTGNFVVNRKQRKTKYVTRPYFSFLVDDSSAGQPQPKTAANRTSFFFDHCVVVSRDKDGGVEIDGVPLAKIQNLPTLEAKQ